MAELNARIIAKASATSGEAPSSADLEVAELAVNTADAVLYTKHTDGSIKAISGGGSGGGGGGSVDSVNGQTGIVNLGIQDMDDFEYNLGSNWYPYSANVNDNQPGGIDAGTNFVDINVADLNGVTHTFPDPAASLWASVNSGSTWEEYAYTNTTSINSGATVRFSGGSWSDPIGGAASVIVTFVDPITFPNGRDPLQEGDILQWNNAEQAFKPAQLPAIPGPAPVDSVNGETGAVSLGIQDMDDYELNQQAGVLVLSDKVEDVTGASPASEWDIFSGGQQFYYSPLQTILTDNLSIGDEITMQVPGMAQPFTTTLTINPVVASTGFVYFNISPDAPAEIIAAPNGTSLTITSPNLPGSPIPLAEGDILQWDDVDQKFRPAQLPAGGGGAVDSVNGETGTVSLGIQDMDDFEYNLGSNWYPYSTSVSTDQPGGINGGSNFVDIAVIDSNGVSHTFPASPASLWVSMDNGSTWEEYAYTSFVFLVAGVTVRFVGDTWSDPLESGTNAIVTFVDPVAFPDGTEPLVEGDILQWNDAEQKFKPVQPGSGGGASGLGDLSDVDTSTAAPTDGQALVWSDTDSEWIPGTISAGGGGATVGYAESTGNLTAYPLAGLDGFYADQAAMEADGFTVISGSTNADDSALFFTPPSQFNGIDYFETGILSGGQWSLNSNGGVGWDTGNQSTQSRTTDALTVAANLDFYVSWFVADSKSLRAGYKTLTTEGRDWLVVRVDMAIPYNSSDGVPVEAWFGTDSSISVRFGTPTGSASLPTGTNQNVIVSNGTAISTDGYGGVTSAGAFAYNNLYTPNNTSIDDSGDVNTSGKAAGQVLTWSGAKWEADDISASIQQATDFSLVGGYTGNNRYSPRTVATNLLAGQWRHDEEIIVWHGIDADGNEVNPLDGLGVGDAFYASADGGEYIELIIGPQFGGISYLGGSANRYTLGLDTSAPNYAVDIFPGATELRLASTIPTPLADGDLIQWVAADQTFKPSSDHISLTTLKGEVAASADFADFQSRIAAL